MRATVPPVNGVTLKAYAGTTGVLLAMDVIASTRTGLLGFAIGRETLSGPKTGAKKWLDGMLNFPGIPHIPGQPVPTNVAPIQKFRWSDYTVYPATAYAYTVHPVYGPPGHPDVRQGPRVQVSTTAEDATHFVLFNRAAAASQAFSREFPGDAIEIYKANRKSKKTLRDLVLSPGAYRWLSRGLLEHIQGFLGLATDSSWALDIAIYEYELQAIRDAVGAAAQRGAKIRLLYHAKKGDPQTTRNKASLKDPPLPAASVTTIDRVTTHLMHDKFIVLSRLQGDTRDAQSVLCGSVNFTENGVYRQANVLHIARDAALARTYLAQFEELVKTAHDPSQTRADVTANNPIVSTQPIFGGFSPRAGQTDLNEFIAIVRAAQRDVLFCTAFDLFPGLLSTLLGKAHDHILRFGIQNQRSTITGYHRDRTANFSATALLDEGLEGWIKESFAKQKGVIHIHTKILIKDFTSETPTVVSGSHNLSKVASDGNDENFLVVRSAPGDTDVPDAYGVELMRIYDHYRFRWVSQEQKRKKKSKAKKEEPLALALDDSWTKAYFGGDALKTADRIRFVGM
jgi:phosphatidylserine/phosphatidylglycerophosphate/cardiolipin synthase-like enzyme